VSCHRRRWRRPRGSPPRSWRSATTPGAALPAATTTPMTLPLPSSSGPPSWRGSGTASTVSTSSSGVAVPERSTVFAGRADRPGGEAHRRERDVRHGDRQVADPRRHRREDERRQALRPDRLEQDDAVGRVGADDGGRVAVPVRRSRSPGRGRAPGMAVDARHHQAAGGDHEAVDDAGRSGEEGIGGSPAW